MTQSEAYRHITVTKLSQAVGAEIGGVDLANLSDEQFGDIHRAFADNGVIFFRDQELSPDQHIAFAQRWGPININRFFKPVDGHPQVAEVRKEPDQRNNIGAHWHTDHSYDQVPAMGSILYAREVPDVGGDTCFAGAAAAYDALSDGMKTTLLGLRAEHSSRHVFGNLEARADTGHDIGARIGNSAAATQDAVHPVVIEHPLSGRPCLYVNTDFTLRFEGWTDAESEPLLDQLYRHIASEEFTCRFRWTPGAIAVWDNRAVQHKALNDYHGHRRLMHRITIEGVPLSAAQ
jgi:taurine dioxygenase